jgi:hypothetical protein
MADRDEDRDNDRDLPESIRTRLEAMVPDLVKKTFAAGMGALFSTEEGIRKIAKDINIPDVAGYLASTADTTKDRVLEIIAREVREFLASVNLGEEVAKMLTALSFEIKTEIRFIPNSERYSGVEPDVKAAVRLKRSDRGKRKPTEPAPAPVEEDAPVDAALEAVEPEAKGSRLRFWRRGTGDTTEESGGDDE